MWQFLKDLAEVPANLRRIAVGVTRCATLLERHSGDVEERLLKLIEHTSNI